MIFSIFSSGGQYIQQSRIEGIIRNISVIFFNLDQSFRISYLQLCGPFY